MNKIINSNKFEPILLFGRKNKHLIFTRWHLHYELRYNWGTREGYKNGGMEREKLLLFQTFCVFG